MNNLKNAKLRQIVHSNWLDFFAVFVILITSFVLNYQQMFYFQSKAVFNVNYALWKELILKGAFPLGLFSILVSCFSMFSARLICKQKNLGNIIGIGTTIAVCIIDFLLGNKSAIITYPLTFLLSIFGTVKWSKGVKIKNYDSVYYLIVILGFLLGYALTFIGFYFFDNSLYWYSNNKSILLFHTIALTFSMSIIANTATAFKYQETWLTWLIYDFIQIIKNILLLNWANVGKYIFYVFNVILTFFDWKLNKDVENN